MTDRAASDATTSGDRSTATRAAETAALIAAVTGIQALATFAVLALATVAPDASATFGVTPETVGYQVSLIYLSAALGSLAAGTFTQQHGAGTMSIIALLLGAAGLAAMVPGLVPLAIAGSLLIGAGYALTNPSASTLLLRHTPPRHRNLIFSIKQTGVPIGGIAAGLLLPFLANHLGWQGAITCGALLSLVAAALLTRRRSTWDTGRQAGRGGLGPMREGLALVWMHPGLRALSLAAFCFAAMQLCLMTFAVTLLVADLGWTLVQAGAALSLLQLSGGLARLVWGRIADRTGRGDLVLAGIGALTACASLSVSLLSPELGSIIVLGLLSLFAAGAIGWNGVFMAEIARQSPARQVGLTTGAVLFFTFAGVVCGPAGFALLFRSIGSYSLTFTAFASLPLIGSLVLLHSGHYQRTAI
jgi:MFS family permease